MISKIISDDSIQLKDEDSLYWLIESRIFENPGIVVLLEFVRFEYLSAESIESFIGMAKGRFYEMPIGIWRSLCCRLSFPISRPCANDRVLRGVASVFCPFSSSSPMDGILSSLATEHGGNLVDSEIISITSSGVAPFFSCPLRDLATVGNRRYFTTRDEANSWICYDFKDMRINLTDYSIRTSWDRDSSHLRCWILEGSIDGLSWTELDRRDNDERLKRTELIGSFVIGDGNREEFRMIRLRQTDRNSGFSNMLVFNAMELFGVVHAPGRQALAGS
jgi:hypothetical protein